MSPRSEELQRIAILAHALRGGGGLSGGRNLLAALGRVAPQYTYLVTIPTGAGYEDICRQLPHCETIGYDHSSLVKRWFFETFRLRKIVAPFCPQVIVALGNRGMPDPPCPQALMVRDSHYFYPRKHYGKQDFRVGLIADYRSWHFRRHLRHCHMLLAQTSVAERRLLEQYGFKGRTGIVSNAVSMFAIAGDGDQSVPEPLHPYVDRMKLFCLTQYYAHKNLEAIPRMFHRFREELADVLVVLTIADDQHPNERKLLRSIERMGLSNHIINVGPLPQGDLGAYYRNCQALFLPTLIESFSATYLEAMHFQAPVLTSDLDFARDVCGDAALYFDPWDTRSIKNAILRLKNDPSLTETLVARGRERLQTTFKSWDEIAADMVSLLTLLCP